jgi:hypothetical protein
MIYEGNVRFEHCYRLDLDVSIVPSHRHACWQDWMSRHTYGQSGDRLAHARRRLEELSRGNQATLPLLGDAGIEQKQVSAPVPMPTNIHSAPPPKVPELKPVATPAVSAIAPTKLLAPETDCAKACQGQWEECSPACIEISLANSSHDGVHPNETATDAGLPSPRAQKESCAVCTRTYKSCMRRCFR